MRTGLVTAAAQALPVSQSAISAVLKHNEQQRRFKLFERTSGRLHPTPEASALLPDVKEVLGHVDTLDRLVQDMRDGITGRLVGATQPRGRRGLRAAGEADLMLVRRVAGARDGTARLRLAIHLAMVEPLSQIRLVGMYARHPRRAPRQPVAKLGARVLNYTLKHRPADGSMEWSSYKLAAAGRCVMSTVQRIWRKHGVRPHRFERHMISNDPDLIPRPPT